MEINNATKRSGWQQCHLTSIRPLHYPCLAIVLVSYLFIVLVLFIELQMSKKYS